MNDTAPHATPQLNRIIPPLLFSSENRVSSVVKVLFCVLFYT